MARLKNRGTVPQGMLAPSGYAQTVVNPNVQATTRPAGTLLVPSPGYDTIRRGKNRFQGKGPSGGFREMEYAEDIGGSGVALAVVPGDTSSLEASEWLAESGDSVDMVISDRGAAQDPSFAGRLHEGYNTIPDMGDRHPSRPLSKSKWLVNPIGMFRADFREDPAMTIAASVAIIVLVKLIAADLERSYRSNRGRGVGSAVTAAPAAVAQTSGDTTAGAANDIGKAADDAVSKISKATDDAVSTIKSTADDATKSVKGAAE